MSSIGLLTNLRDVIAILGVPSAIYASYKAINEFKNSNTEKHRATIERARENRHKQAIVARDALKDLFNSEKSKAAMQMLDWSGRIYTDGSSQYEIGFNDIESSLRIKNLSFNSKERFIRDCFDDFFNHIELIQHYIDIEFIHFEDVSVPLNYYTKKMFKNYYAYQPFLSNYGYPLTIKFIKASSIEKTENQGRVEQRETQC